MKILFYQPYNQAAIYIESIAEQLAIRGNKIFFLTHEEYGVSHQNMEKWGTKTFSSKIIRRAGIIYYFKRILYVAFFCRKNKINIVYSHYQESNIIAVFAQFLCQAKFIFTRHHTDCAFIDSNWKERWADKIINRLAKYQIAPSKKVFIQLVKIEHANPEKIKLINYGYNFNAITEPNPIVVKEIRRNYFSKILLLTAARLIPEKRHNLLINEVNKLVSVGVNVKLVILGRGPLEEEIKQLIEELKLENNIFYLGFKSNIMDYYAASDLIVHFSESEASNSAIKEASLTNTPVMVCNNVGDFDDYIVDGQNGFILDKDIPGLSFSVVIEKILNDEYNLNQIGSQLHQDVKDRFDISNVIDQYLQFNEVK